MTRPDLPASQMGSGPLELSVQDLKSLSHARPKPMPSTYPQLLHWDVVALELVIQGLNGLANNAHLVLTEIAPQYLLELIGQQVRAQGFSECKQCKQDRFFQLRHEWLG